MTIQNNNSYEADRTNCRHFLFRIEPGTKAFKRFGPDSSGCNQEAQTWSGDASMPLARAASPATSDHSWTRCSKRWRHGKGSRRHNHDVIIETITTTIIIMIIIINNRTIAMIIVIISVLQNNYHDSTSRVQGPKDCYGTSMIEHENLLGSSC